MEFKENYTQQLQRLNEYQKAAVFDESNACLVNANVGSGKTTVLITKVMYLHYEKQIPYEQMVILTFTNKAADEIKERLYALEPEIAEEQLWGFGTFHSVCLTMLKKMLPVENLGLYQRIYGDGSGRRTWDGRAVDLNLSAENQI